MEVFQTEESPSLDTGMAGVSEDPQPSADPLNPPSNDRDDGIPRTTFAGNEEFTPSHDRTRLRSFLRYARSVFAISLKLLLDFTNANNESLLSKLIRIFITGFAYLMYTSGTGMMLWAIAYLMDHGWYLLAATGSVMLLLACCFLLVVLEWMWSWQGRALTYLGDNGYHRLRSVVVLDDDEMEDDLTLRGWVRHFVRALVSCLVWSLYCVLNVKMDFWITDLYKEARPSYYKIELQLVNCFEAAPILLGSAVLLYFAYPSFYRWHSLFEGLLAYARGVDENANFASTEELDSEGYTIQVNDDHEVSMGVGMQNLII